MAANRLVKFWSTAGELPGPVALSLSKTIKTYPAVGWIRADKAGNTELLSDINELRKRNEELEQQLSRSLQSATVTVPNLAPLEDSVTIFGYTSPLSGRLRWEYETTWRELFAMIAPFSSQTAERRQS